MKVVEFVRNASITQLVLIVRPASLGTSGQSEFFQMHQNLASLANVARIIVTLEIVKQNLESVNANQLFKEQMIALHVLTATMVTRSVSHATVLQRVPS